MATEAIKFPMSGGLDRSKATHLSAPEDFYDLMNFRPSREEAGALEQTPYFKSYSTVTYGTGDTATSAISGMFPIQENVFLTLGRRGVYLASSGSTTQIPVFQQSLSVGSGFSLATGCMVRGNLVTAGIVVVGNALEIEIEVGATTFKYRINGGAYTTGVAIAKGGVSILSGNATVYFLTTTGFTAGWTWTWTRQDSLDTFSFESTMVRQPQFIPNEKGSVYFLPTNYKALSPEVYLYRCDFIGNGYIVYTAGYRPVYGSEICAFADHLFIVGQTYGFANTQGTVLSWSDRADFDNFLPSDLNEADFKTFTSPINTGLQKIVGLYATTSQIFLFTRSETWVSSYLGLPIVFNFTLFSNRPFTIPYPDRNYQVVFTVGQYALVFSQEGWFLFDGGQFTLIGLPVSHAFLGTDFTSAVRFCFVTQWQEIVMLSGTRLYCFSLTKRLWYSRSVSFLNGTPNCLAVNALGNCIHAGLTNMQIVMEDLAWSGTPLADSAVGTAYTLPLARKHLFNAGSFFRVKDLTGQTFLSCRVDTTPTSGYYTNADVFVNIFFRRIAHQAVEMKMPAARELIDANTATWNNAGTRNTFPGPRYAVRALAFELELAGFNTSKPPGKVFLYDIETEFRTSATPKR